MAAVPRAVEHDLVSDRSRIGDDPDCVGPELLADVAHHPASRVVSSSWSVFVGQMMSRSLPKRSSISTARSIPPDVIASASLFSASFRASSRCLNAVIGSLHHGASRPRLPRTIPALPRAIASPAFAGPKARGSDFRHPPNGDRRGWNCVSCRYGIRQRSKVESGPGEFIQAVSEVHRGLRGRREPVRRHVGDNDECLKGTFGNVSREIGCSVESPASASAVASLRCLPAASGWSSPPLARFDIGGRYHRQRHECSLADCGRDARIRTLRIRSMRATPRLRRSSPALRRQRGHSPRRRRRVQVRIDLLRDRDAGIGEDLRELEDVAAGCEEEAGEGVAEVVETELLRQRRRARPRP